MTNAPRAIMPAENTTVGMRLLCSSNFPLMPPPPALTPPVGTVEYPDVGRVEVPDVGVNTGEYPGNGTDSVNGPSVTLALLTLPSGQVALITADPEEALSGILMKELKDPSAATMFPTVPNLELAPP